MRRTGSVRYLREAVRCLREAERYVREAVRRLREAVRYVREAVRRLRGAVRYVREAVRRLREAVRYVRGAVRVYGKPYVMYGVVLRTGRLHAAFKRVNAAFAATRCCYWHRSYAAFSV